MSALPGHDRMAEDDARAEARSVEHDGPVSVNAPGRDLLAELKESVERARKARRAVSEPTNRDE